MFQSKKMNLNILNHAQSEMDQKIESAKIQNENEICNADQWSDFIITIKSNATPVIMCVTPGASSELIYDAFLQEGITPQSIFCPDQFHTLYGKKINSDRIPVAEECIWCLVGARQDSRIDAILSDIVHRQDGYRKNIYVLSKIGCILPDTGLSHMICHSRNIVLMGEKRMCSLMEKYCLDLGDIKIAHVTDKTQVEAYVKGEGAEAIWFYVDIPSKELPEKYRAAYEICRQSGIYLSRYFADHLMWFRKEWSSHYFTEEEMSCMECLKRIQSMVDESRGDSHVSDKKRCILFLASHLSYILYGMIPLLKYYLSREDTICTVVFPYVWNILKIGQRNLQEVTENISEIRKYGGIVRFDNSWYPDVVYESCYLSLGFSFWYNCGIGKDIRKASRTVISLQSIAFHTHYYASEDASNDYFEDMFAENHRKNIDYAAASCFMTEWAAQKEEKWRAKLLPLGYPRMDVLYEDLNNCKIPKRWKMIAEGKKVFFYNGSYTTNLFQYCYEYCRKDKAVIVLRPHPYYFDTPQTRGQIEKLREEKNIIIDTNQSYNEAIIISNAFITDFRSSIMVNYLFTDKPVLILDRGYLNIKNDAIDFRDEAWYKASYAANDEDAGRRFVDMIMDGRDDEKIEKMPYRKFMQQGFDGKVCERIASFAETGGETSA